MRCNISTYLKKKCMKLGMKTISAEEQICRLTSGLDKKKKKKGIKKRIKTPKQKNNPYISG